MLRLHVVQAEYGDSLILEFGQPNSPRFILVDGGPADVYEQHLRTQLERIGEGGGRLELVVLSHVDEDHVRGLLDLLSELWKQRQRGEPETIAIDGLWHNSFRETMGSEVESGFRSFVRDIGGTRGTMGVSDRATKSIAQGDQLTRTAMDLDLPINAEFAPATIVSVDEADGPLVLGDLTLRIVGPTNKNLARLGKKWIAWLKKHKKRLLVRDPVLAERAAVAADGSVPNLSSIMILAESDGKRVLLTGDSRADHLLQGLRKEKLVGLRKGLHVDVLKLPHHGSVRNVSEQFFRKVTADTYVISANGKHGNPDLDTLTWIVTAAKKQERPIDLACTNDTESLRRLTEQCPPEEYGYQLTIMNPGEHAMSLELAE